ncbi:MAG TPA: glycosyltransferase family 2 protein [Candidatus Binatia bacterium]|nr:glycosyltransferase family 2 protein [Candidatus Binatia bacterium]
MNVAPGALEGSVDVSVVVPFFEEEESVAELFDELLAVLDREGIAGEVVAIDDGSTDATFQRLSEAHARDPRVRVVRFRRNFGQTAALAAGFAHARGRVIVTMDGDLQNDPADIPRLLAKLEEGWDVVSGWRRERQDDVLTRIVPSQIANRIISHATQVQLHDYGCGIKAYRADIARSLHLYGEMHRFLPAIAGDLGAAVTEIPVHHRPRTRGRSKYGLSRTVRVLLDLLTVKFLSDFSTRPIQVFGLIGLAGAALGTLMIAVLGFERLVLGIQLGNRPIVLLAILLVVAGFQFITFGLLGEMLARTYHESQGKPIYVVREVLE